MSRLPSISRLLPLIVAALPIDAQRAPQPDVQSTSAPVLTIAGKRFRDLNRNGKLDPYEDWRLPPAARARDLVSQMTLDEKVGAAV
ncbi:MAG TPA: hypothetical protein VF929_08550, partial [Gemmatimonadaceae bacterium]